MSPWAYLQGGRLQEVALEKYTFRCTAEPPGTLQAPLRRGHTPTPKREESPPGTELSATDSDVGCLPCWLSHQLQLASGDGNCKQERVSRVEGLLIPSHCGRGGSENPSHTNRPRTPPRRRVRAKRRPGRPTFPRARSKAWRAWPKALRARPRGCAAAHPCSLAPGTRSSLNPSPWSPRASLAISGTHRSGRCRPAAILRPANIAPSHWLRHLGQWAGAVLAWGRHGNRSR